MQFSYTAVLGGVLLKNHPDFDLSQTLDCGQCFRWFPTEQGGWSGVAMGHSLNIQIQHSDLLFQDISLSEFEQIWIPYFDLAMDYSKIRESLCEIHPVLKQAASYAQGIRIIRQDPWEALCTFIISQNNNIPRIRGIVDRLCREFGSYENGIYTFPTPERLSSLCVEDLAPLRSGFRAKYILSAAQKIACGEISLSEISTLPLNEARDRLTTIYGVGVKVAECALLYGFHRLDAFPLDVWMKRAMQELFGGMNPQNFGPYAGIAQQYIFHYSRQHPELFSEKRAV